MKCELYHSSKIVLKMLTHSNAFCWWSNLSIMIVPSMGYSFYHISKLPMVVSVKIHEHWFHVGSLCWNSCHFIALQGTICLICISKCKMLRYDRKHNDYVFVISEHCDDTCSWKIRAQRRQHYNDVIMSEMASQITSLMIVYSTVYSDADQRKHQSSASLAFVREFTGDQWIPRTNGQ